MSKFVYRRVYNPDINMTSGTQPVSRGGTSATTASQALTNLGMIASNRLDVAGGAARLDANLKVSAANLPTGYGSGTVVSIDGPAKLEPGATGVYTITDYDEKQSYDVTVSAGTAKREDEVITVVAPSTAGNVTLTVGGQTFNLEVTANASTPGTPTGQMPKTAPVIYSDPTRQDGTPYVRAPGQEYTGYTLQYVIFAVAALAGAAVYTFTTRDNPDKLFATKDQWVSALINVGATGGPITIGATYVFDGGNSDSATISVSSVSQNITSYYIAGGEVYGTTKDGLIIYGVANGGLAAGSASYPAFNVEIRYHDPMAQIDGVIKSLYVPENVFKNPDADRISKVFGVAVAPHGNIVLIYDRNNTVGTTNPGGAFAIEIKKNEVNGAVVSKTLFTLNLSSAIDGNTRNFFTHRRNSTLSNPTNVQYAISSPIDCLAGYKELMVYQLQSHFSMVDSFVLAKPIVIAPSGVIEEKPVNNTAEIGTLDWTPKSEDIDSIECSPDGRMLLVNGPYRSIVYARSGQYDFLAVNVVNSSGQKRHVRFLNNVEFAVFHAYADNNVGATAATGKQYTLVEVFSVRFQASGYNNSDMAPYLHPATGAHMWSSAGDLFQTVTTNLPYSDPNAQFTKVHNSNLASMTSKIYRNVLNYVTVTEDHGHGLANEPTAVRTAKARILPVPLKSNIEPRIDQIVDYGNYDSTTYPLSGFGSSALQSTYPAVLDWADNGEQPNFSFTAAPGNYRTHVLNEKTGLAIIVRFADTSNTGYRRVGTIVQFFNYRFWDIQLLAVS